MEVDQGCANCDPRREIVRDISSKDLFFKEQLRFNMKSRKLKNYIQRRLFFLGGKLKNSRQINKDQYF